MNTNNIHFENKKKNFRIIPNILISVVVEKNCRDSRTSWK